MTEIEAATVRAAIEGDPQAFASIVEQYHRVVLGAVYRLLGPRSVQDAEDHAQDIFVKLARTISTFQFDKQTKFSTWFYAFVRNHCFDVLKKRRLRTVSLSGSGREEDEGPLSVPSSEPSPVRKTQQAELRGLLSSSIARLDEPERLVFVMREIEGQDYETISQTLGIAVGTAKDRLHRAKEALRTKLGPYLREGTT